MGITRTDVRSDDGSAVLSTLGDAYERGWQPADVLHVTRRSLSVPEVRLAAWAILYHARNSRASVRAPRNWVDQIGVIADQHRDPGNLVSTPGNRTAVALLWRRLPRMVELCPPPSRWPAERDDLTPPSGADPKVLNRIRNMLAEAEGCEFAEEAEGFTARAQELMTKHVVGAALQAEGSESIGARRIHLDNPYVEQKAQLLAEIAEPNHVRTVWISNLAMTAVVGTPADLEQVELLFTSLLVQATRAMQQQTRRSGVTSTTAFRRAFLYGFAVRIGERLRQAGARATIAVVNERSLRLNDVLPMLRSRAEAVDTEFDRLFPEATPMTAQPSAGEGWDAGHAAADRAMLQVAEPKFRAVAG